MAIKNNIRSIRFSDRFKWALVGGLGYMAARFLFQGLRTLIGG